MNHQRMNSASSLRLSREVLILEQGRIFYASSLSNLKSYERYIIDISNNEHLWTVQFHGPANTPYEGGVFTVQYALTQNYPFAAPIIQMITPIFHMNISSPEQRISFQDLSEDWTPQYSLVHVRPYDFV